MMKLMSFTPHSISIRNLCTPIGLIVLFFVVLVVVSFLQINSHTTLMEAKEKAQTIKNRIKAEADNARLYQRYQAEFDSLMRWHGTAAGNRLRWQKYIEDGLFKFSDQSLEELQGVGTDSHFTLDRRERWQADAGDNASIKLPHSYATQSEFELAIENENLGFHLLHDLLISGNLLAHIDGCQMQLVDLSDTWSSLTLGCSAQLFDFEWHADDYAGQKQYVIQTVSKESDQHIAFLQKNRRLLGMGGLDHNALRNKSRVTESVPKITLRSGDNKPKARPTDKKSASVSSILNQTFSRSQRSQLFLPNGDGYDPEYPNYFLGQRVTRIWNNLTHKEDAQ